MQVAMQLARINRMRGIVIVDPVVHRFGNPAKQEFRPGNPSLRNALDRSTIRVHHRQFRFPTGRFTVSKAKSEKVSPDLDTPTDLPQAAVDKISASLNTLLADAFALYLKTKN